MNIWAGIKKALNSTLGTSEFKPLDELFNMHCGIYATTDHTLKVLLSEGYLKLGDSVSAKINATGRINVYFSSILSTHTFQILINGQHVAYAKGTHSNTYNPYSISVDVKYGDIIKILSTAQDNKYNDLTISLRGLTYFAPTGGIVENV